MWGELAPPTAPQERLCHGQVGCRRRVGDRRLQPPPGVFWAIRDRGGRSRPGRPGNALYAFKVVDGRVGEVAGDAANLSGADLSTDRRRLAVDSHTMLYVYAAGDPSLDGEALVADLIRRPPAWTVRLAGRGPGPTNLEGVAFTHGGHDLNPLAENRDVFFVPAGAYER
jgi:hypothetical protein